MDGCVDGVTVLNGQVPKLSRISSLTKIDVPVLPFLRHVHREPSCNFHGKSSTDSANHSCSNEEGMDYCTYELESSMPKYLIGLLKVHTNEVRGKL